MCFDIKTFLSLSGGSDVEEDEELLPEPASDPTEKPAKKRKLNTQKSQQTKNTKTLQVNTDV